MGSFDNATIAAIATPPGIGAVGIVRMSGQDATAIAQQVFRKGRTKRHVNFNFVESHRMLFGSIVDPSTDEIVDQVLLAWMKAPQTYTGQDTIEIYGHGGPVPLHETLRLLLTAGARLAEPGEFTMRAWLNGRIDLTQAEAVNQVVSARSAEGLRLALHDLAGNLRTRIVPAQQALVSLLAWLDAVADFPEDEVPPVDLDAEMATARRVLQDVIRSAAAGMRFRDGVHVALIGKPNAGKSSLLNALLKVERAIVTPVPGTTRDVIAEQIELDGVPITLLDTAGIGDSSDPVELIGIERSDRAISAATLVILVLDGSQPASQADRDIVTRLVNRGATIQATSLPVLVAVNKSDQEQVLDVQVVLEPLGDVPVVAVSALTGDGIPELEQALSCNISGDARGITPAILSVRQQSALERALHHLDHAVTARGEGFAIDLLATDVRAGLHEVGMVTGENVDEAVLTEIFSRFCIGK